MTGIEVRVDAEGWEDVRPKAAVAANVGSGPDIIISTMEDAHQYPDKLVDVSRRRQLSRQQVRRLVRGGQGLRHARQEVGRDHDGRRRRHARRPREPDQGGGLRSIPARHGRLPQAVPGAQGQGHAGRLRARQRDRRLELDVLAPVGARRQAGRRQEQRRHQQPGDDRRARILEAALRHVHPGDAVVARPEQQQGVPRRPDRADQQRHLGLLRGEDVAGPEAPGDGERHPALSLPAGGRRQVPRVESRVPDDDLQVLEVPERREGVSGVHDGARAVRAVAGGVDRLRVPSARAPTSRARSGRPTRRRRRIATA